MPRVIDSAIDVDMPYGADKMLSAACHADVFFLFAITLLFVFAATLIIFADAAAAPPYGALLADAVSRWRSYAMSGLPLRHDAADISLRSIHYATACHCLDDFSHDAPRCCRFRHHQLNQLRPGRFAAALLPLFFEYQQMPDIPMPIRVICRF